MSKLERAYIDSAGQTFKKVKASDGRTMHFKDGTPISQNAFNGGTANLVEEGERVGVAVPNPDSPVGYNRIEVSQKEASSLGQELRLQRDDVPGQPQQTILLDGEEYDIEELTEINDDIIRKWGPDAVMKY